MPTRLAALRNAAPFNTLQRQPAATPEPQAPRQRSPFHSTHPRKTDDHYATLEVPPTASHTDIKTQFYRLSKAHHPDHNPHNAQSASQKFVAISAAYAVLGDPAKRQKYDADLARARGGGSAHARPAHHTGSYSSSASYAPGGRKASGLSKRRNQFRGPPPSFYRAGGWGRQSATRQANVGRDARDHEARQQQQQGSGSAGASGGYGSGYGYAYSGAGAAAAAGAESGAESWPFQTDPNDVAHFDREGHYRRTTTVEDQLRVGRLKRRAAQMRGRPKPDAEDESGSSLGRFVWISGMLVVGFVVVPLWRAGR